ncbi:MAG: glutathione peroxidase [Verrucomicrobiales bacterium]
MLGFPCNQFGAQEPGTNEEIAEFARSKYDVTFPMFAKIDVNGEGAAELYKMLRDQQPGSGESSDIKWNFEKFLVNPAGEAVARWDTGTTPEDIREQLPELMA